MKYGLESSYECLIEELPEMVFTVDVNNNINYYNKTFSDFFGSKRNEYIYDFLNEKVHPDDLLKTQDAFNNLFSNGKTFKIEIRLKNKQLEYIWMMVNGKTFYDKEKNQICGFLFAAVDINTIKKSEQELIRLKEAAEMSNMMKSESLASMSHEIRTPLNGILGMIDLTMLTDLTAEQRENLSIATDCAQLLIGIINNILDISKINAGKMKLKRQEFKIKELIEKTVKLHIVHAENKGLKLNYKVQNGLDNTLIGDYNRIQQILNNLISNAIKFTDTGNVIVNVNKLSENESGIVLKFSVKDTGIGIAQEDMDKLFNSYSQIGGSFTRQFGGTGLGLVISKKLVEMMDGEMEVESIKNIGSNFSFNIKLNYLKDNEENKLTSISEKDDELIIDSSKLILIVEDDIVNQKVISKMLGEMKHRYEIAQNGQEALKKIKYNKYDLILMDIQMPVMNGLDTVNIIRKNEEITGTHIPIIALTAYAQQEDRQKFIKAGMDDYLSKPINIYQLNKCINNIVSKDNKIKLQEDNLDFNWAALNEPKLNMKNKIVYIKQICKHINKLKEFLKEEDISGCEKEAYSIKKYSEIIGSVLLKNSSFRIVLAARRKDLMTIKAQLPIIIEEFNRIKKQEQ